MATASAFGFAVIFCMISIKSQSTICFIVDGLYGNSDAATSWGSNNYDDPRSLMGTFTLIMPESTDSILDVDFDAGVYRHSNYGESSANYIFKIRSIGWVIAKDATPNTATSDNILLTCFRPDILSCFTYSWYNGYNSVL